MKMTKTVWGVQNGEVGTYQRVGETNIALPQRGGEEEDRS